MDGAMARVATYTATPSSSTLSAHGSTNMAVLPRPRRGSSVCSLCASAKDQTALATGEYQGQ